MSFLVNYGLFFAKTLTIVIAIVIILAAIFAIKAKAKQAQQESLCIKKLNEKYDNMTDEINDAIQTKQEKKSFKKIQKKESKEKKLIEKNNINNRIFIVRFYGDMKAAAVDSLRESITAILLTAKQNDRVLICLESGGGMVHAYGLAASQLQRIRDAKIPLIVSIDKIAASGGYMMACVANEIIAAPFAIVGSIGVIAQLPNLHRFLKKKDIEFEQLTAGEYKRTLTVFGENTDAGRKKMQSEIDETHELFKTFVKTHRAQVDIDQIATGEHWFATQCIEKKLVDKLQTSDDYLLSNKDTHALYEIEYKLKKPFAKRVSGFVQNTLHQLTHENI